MKRGPKPPSRLSNILTQLNAGPRLELPSIRRLRVSFASHNDHFGARHFVKDDLPRIRYANPDIHIDVIKQRKTKEDNWRPDMLVELTNNTTHCLNLQDKWSSVILKELVDLALTVPHKPTGKTKLKVDITALHSLSADHQKVPPSIAQLPEHIRLERVRYPTLEEHRRVEERTKALKATHEGIGAALP